jgi:outer membrane protein OmpA-like peptidoglycan-associated protein
LLGDCATNPGQGKPRKTRTVVRTVQRQDLETAHEYRQGFYLCGSGEESYPGSTAFGVSAAVLRELNAKGQTPLKVAVANPAAAFGSLVKGLLGGASKAVDDASILSGVLTRVERGTLPFKVLVNDEEVELPAVHAQERFGDEVMEFWILNDPANPLILRVSATNGSQFLQVIKLSYPSSAGASSASGASSRPTDAATSRIERDLAERGRTTIYGIYFDFASDRLKPESNLVLAEIAHVLQKNPGWSLAVDGHTDNVGGDPYNLDLSKRRAAAVKQALVTQYRIDERRLQTNGYGASRPKDTNDTVEGRSRNRRVELVKTS